MSNIQLKPVPQSQFDETKSAEDLFLSGYTDKAGVKKNVRIKASSFVGAAHAKAYEGNIFDTNMFSLSASEEMYVGSISGDVTLSETNVSSCYGTLYLFIKNDTDKDHSLTLPEENYHFFPQGKNKIAIPAKSYIELAIKAYGMVRVVTNLSGLGDSSEGAGSEAVLERVAVLEKKINTFFNEGGTISGNLKVVGDVRVKRILKEE